MTQIDKAQLRRQLRRERSAFVAALPGAIQRLAFRVLPSPVLRLIPPESCVALYFPMGAEAPTEGIAVQLANRGNLLCLPRLHDNAGHMDFAPWHVDDELAPGLGGIPEPDAALPAVIPDVILTPLVGFDDGLNRMGQGAGYYDRAFAACPQALRIGLAWSVQRVADSLPVDPWDVPLHMVVTESAIFEPVSA